MATFKTFAKDGKSLPFIFQSAQSSSTGPLVSLAFRNRDAHSKTVYEMANISVYDGGSLGGDVQRDGYGVLSISTASNGVLEEAIHIDEYGRIGINNSNPQYRFHVVGDTAVDGNIAINGDLTVNGERLTTVSNFSGDVTIQSNLTVGKDVTVASNVVINGDLTVLGTSSISSSISVFPSGIVVYGGIADIQSGMEVSGNTYFYDGIEVAGSSTFGDVNIGSATLSNTLTVSGSTYLEDTLDVSGVATLCNSATVKGLLRAEGGLFSRDQTVLLGRRRLTPAQSNSYEVLCTYDRTVNEPLREARVRSWSYNDYALRVYIVEENSVLAESSFSNLAAETCVLPISGDTGAPGTIEIHYRPTTSNQSLYAEKAEIVFDLP